MNSIPPETTRLLIETGKLTSNDTEILNMLHRIKEQDFINRLGPRNLQKTYRDMETSELIALVKGLTLAEKVFRWIGGSAASVIWLFWEVEKRDQIAAEKLSSWIYENSENPYLPFGSQRFRTSSLSNYRVLVAHYKIQLDKYERKRIEIEKQAEKSRMERSEQRIYSAQFRKTEIRNNFIKDLFNKSLTEQLKQLAKDNKYSVGFYPTNIAGQATSEFLMKLDEKLQNDLLEKLKGRYNGPWGQFKKRLLHIYREKKGTWNSSTPWDKEPWYL